MKKQVNQPTVETEQLTVEYWRGRFAKAYKQFDGLTDLWKVLAEVDDEFVGVPGYRRIENVKREKGNLVLTAKAVQLMERLRPVNVKDDLSAILRRQNLVAPEN